MTPAARIQAAIGLLDDWLAGDEQLDRLLAGWGRRNRYAGSGDRHAIADLVYDAVRQLRSASWLAGCDTVAGGRRIMLGLVLAQGGDPDSVFTGDRHAPAPLTGDERAPIRNLAGAPRAVRLDYPDALAEAFAEIDDAVIEALRRRAPLDLRANLLRTDRDGAVQALAEEGIEAAPVPLSPTALRVTAGQRRVRSSRAFRDGLVEIQDAASQAIADLAAAAPGETALDLCAGGGGKTLAMAAAMSNRGRLIAHDIAPARMSGLAERARRAGARVEFATTAGLASLSGACDLVLVDAPCSGSGAWRRNPDAKWRLTPARLAELREIQSELLVQAARLTAPSGRVVYATCSLFRCENDDRVEAFLAAHGWRLAREIRFTPLDDVDGFYGAVLAPV